MPIPKIIHQTYKNHTLPEIYKLCQDEIKKLHPEFEYRFYTDEIMDNIMKTEFSEYYNEFNKLPRMIMKIDMFRYFLMYKYGGIYADMDYLMFKPFDLLNYNCVIPCNREDNDGNPECLGNCFFASEPYHPFWKLLMDSLKTIDRNKIDYKDDKNVDSYIFGTGPKFVYYMWQVFCKDYKELIYIPKRELFHPPTIRDQSYINNLKSKSIYGMHICSGLWRDNKL